LIASHLLEIPFLKLAGGLAILWIAVKLLLEESEDHGEGKQPATVWHAVWMILIADLTMSIDNVLAVAGVSHGNMTQLWLSLGLSIPLVVFASTLLSSMMDRFPIILILGAALLGKVGGEMIVTDPVITTWMHIPESRMLRFSVQAVTTLGVLALAWRIKRRRPSAQTDGDEAAKREAAGSDAGSGTAGTPGA
jgi:YjbE family integral membrane protein